MTLIDRWWSGAFVVGGLLLIFMGLTTNVSDQTARSLFFVGIDCLLFSAIGLFFPRSNQQVKHQMANFLQFAILAVASFSAVALLVYIAFGSPRPIGEEIFTTALTLGLASALIIPIIAKQLTLKATTKP